MTALDERPPADVEPTGPGSLTPRELVRWSWRQLTSMRTALLLLLLLALAAVPGSVVPQNDLDAIGVGQWKRDHPTLAPLYQRLGLFSVYDSVWFSAIYLLLMVSLVGCIVPRLAVHARAVRATPPPAPRNLSRLPAYVSVQTAESPEAVLERARSVLRRRRYRVRVTDGSVAAERGHLREAGNLMFHMSVVVVLVAFAYGQLLGFKGGSIVLVGGGFANSLTQYDEFTPGTFFDPEALTPLSFTVDDFEAEFQETGPSRGQPLEFHADLTYREDLAAEEQEYRLEVNEPLVLDGVSVFLVGHGYAPVLTVRDGGGEKVSSGPVVFRPEDPSLVSFGVLKVPEASPQGLGFDGLFFPSYVFVDGDPVSVFPDALNPTVSMTAYAGDLGMDTGEPQSLYTLDTSRMSAIRAGGKDLRIDLQPGDTVELPNGLGSVTYDRTDEWVQLQVSHTPGKGIALAGIVAGLAGLMGSLFIRRRRAWVRVTGSGHGALVEVAGLDRSTVSEGLEDEVRAVAAALVPGSVTDTASSPPDGDDPEVDRA